MFIRILKIVYASILLVSCVTPLDLDPEISDELIVVEGYITDQPGPHLIKIGRTSRYSDPYFSESLREVKAVIKDDLGNVYELQDSIRVKYPYLVVNPETITRKALLDVSVFYGFKTAADFRADPLRKYTLEFEYEDHFYISNPSKILPAVEVDSVYAEFEAFPTSNPSQFNTMVHIYAKWDDPPEVQNFYAWHGRNTYQYGPGGSCYMDEICFSERMMTDQLLNGATIHQKILTLPYDGIRFSEPYYLRLSQLNLTREAYQFYQLINNQLEINGDIFDPPPAVATTNIHSLDQEAPRVVGFFGAYQVGQYNVLLQDLIPRSHLNTIVWRGPCETHLGKGSTKMPTDWPD